MGSNLSPITLKLGLSFFPAIKIASYSDYFTLLIYIQLYFNVDMYIRMSMFEQHIEHKYKLDQ